MRCAHHVSFNDRLGAFCATARYVELGDSQLTPQALPGLGRLDAAYGLPSVARLSRAGCVALCTSFNLAKLTSV